MFWGGLMMIVWLAGVEVFLTGYLHRLVQMLRSITPFV